jgi:hypothetical protein
VLTVQLEREKEQISALQVSLSPLAERHAERVLYGSLGYLAIQAGVISRLVWWDLDWGIMEPFTWLITFSTGIIGYMFYVVTRSEYEYTTLFKSLTKRRLNKLMNARGVQGDALAKLQASIDKLKA